MYACGILFSENSLLVTRVRLQAFLTSCLDICAQINDSWLQCCLYYLDGLVLHCTHWLWHTCCALQAHFAFLDVSLEYLHNGTEIMVSVIFCARCCWVLLPIFVGKKFTSFHVFRVQSGWRQLMPIQQPTTTMWRRLESLVKYFCARLRRSEAGK